MIQCIIFIGCLPFFSSWFGTLGVGGPLAFTPPQRTLPARLRPLYWGPCYPFSSPDDGGRDVPDGLWPGGHCGTFICPNMSGAFWHFGWHSWGRFHMERVGLEVRAPPFLPFPPPWTSAPGLVTVVSNPGLCVCPTHISALRTDVIALTRARRRGEELWSSPRRLARKGAI